MSQPRPTAQGGKFALIALGSNANSIWGDARDTVLKAMLEAGIALGGPLTKSALYATPAFPAGAGPDFVNAAIRLRTGLDARSVDCPAPAPARPQFRFGAAGRSRA